MRRPRRQPPERHLGSSATSSGAADARLDILPERPVGGALFANYARAILPEHRRRQPRTCRSTRTTSAAAASSSLQPGQRHARLAFRVPVPCDASSRESAGKPYDNTDARGVHAGSLEVPARARRSSTTRRFASSATTNAELAQPVPLVTSTPVRARIGLNGLITDRFALLAMVGWGASFYDTTLPNQPQFDSVIAQAELRWFLSGEPGYRERRRTWGSRSRRLRSGTRGTSRIAISAATTPRTAGI